MSKQVTVDVAEATYDLGQAIRKFIGETKKALADGWQPGSDIPAILTAVYLDLIPQIQNVSKVAQETTDLKPFLAGLVLSMEDITFDLVAK